MNDTGTIQPIDHFGAAVAGGDVNNDGCADLVVGAPGVDDRGEVYLFDGKGELDQAEHRSWAWHRLRWRTGQTVAASGKFGYSLAVGDLDGDDQADIAIGAPYDGTGGYVFLLKGQDFGGYSFPGMEQRISQATGGGALEPDDQFGYSLAIGPFDYVSGINALAVGSPGDGPGNDPLGSGIVFLFRGGAPSGLVTQWAFIHQESPGPGGWNELHDRFGHSVAFAPLLDGSSWPMLSVGAPQEAPGSEPRAGVVYLYDGNTTSTGLPVKTGYLDQEHHF